MPRKCAIRASLFAAAVAVLAFDSAAANAISLARASSGICFDFDSTNAFALSAGSIGGSGVMRVDCSA